MPDFDSHIDQVKSNLRFLEGINESQPEFYDWQVTTCFYIAVHLVNAHLSKYNCQFRSHNDVDRIIGTNSVIAFAKLPEEYYVSYKQLQILARRSRYLVWTKDNKIGSEKPSFTYETHLKKALIHLENLIGYFNKTYKLKLTPIRISCEGIKPHLKHKFILPK